jgi:hypothetical protein
MQTGGFLSAMQFRSTSAGHSLDKELTRCTDVVGVFPNSRTLPGLAGSRW